MLENKTPIIKTSIAAFSILISRYKEILFLSILPAILMTPAIFSLPEILSQLKTTPLGAIVVPNTILIYSILFIYGYASLNINLYRLVVIGFNATFKLGIIPFKISINFIFLSILISLFNFAPIILQIPILEPVIFIFIAHLMLNLVIIATGNKVIKWKLSFMYRLNIALLQFVLPVLVVSLFAIIGGIIAIIAKIFLVYWTAINLALIFNQLITDRK